ncbi:MAG: prephenate dehydrogenase/arogenate dehydrogenase family protein [Candidatus Gastranaerophilales bacterium]|nr:prephenate dehydrogenase/arogenate dehydrogenase family protein [Candidatus Gastranaerophilales bacterium]
MKNSLLKVGIIGLGLIGASLLKRLSQKKYEIFCYSKSSYKKAKKYSKFASDDINIIKGCDIVFVCSKISETLNILDELNKILDKNTIVVDVASVKEKKYKKYKFEFILSHPMAGSEKSGFNAADENLFVGAKWLVEKENKILEKIIKDTGAISLKFDMKKHNLACAQISHLPAILSFLLYDCASNDSKQIASSGFRDTTRLAMTNSDLVFSMFKNNEENILKTFDLLTKKLNRLKNLSDNERIKLFEAIAQNRAKMYDKNGKNIFKI